MRERDLSEIDLGIGVMVMCPGTRKDSLLKTHVEKIKEGVSRSFRI